jgi:hypothetical protein
LVVCLLQDIERDRKPGGHNRDRDPNADQSGVLVRILDPVHTGGRDGSYLALAFWCSGLGTFSSSSSRTRLPERFVAVDVVGEVTFG